MMKKHCTLDVIALILVVIGALNWASFGMFHVDLIAHVFGSFTTLSQIIYVLVGLSGIYLILRAVQCCKKCESSCTKQENQ
jgi:hypothetical protein